MAMKANKATAPGYEAIDAEWTVVQGMLRNTDGDKSIPNAHSIGKSPPIYVVVATSLAMVFIALGFGIVVFLAINMLIPSWGQTAAFIFATLCWSTIMIVMLKQFFPLLSGDYAAVMDSRNRNDRMEKQSEHQLEAFGLLADVKLSEQETQRQLNEQNFKVTMGRNATHHLEDELRDLRDSHNQLILGGGNQGLVVPGHRQEMVVDENQLRATEEARDYTKTLFLDGHHRNPERVSENWVLVQHKLPWNAEWSGQPWVEIAKHRIGVSKNQPTDNPVLIPKGTAWQVHEEARSLSAALHRIDMAGGPDIHGH